MNLFPRQKNEIQIVPGPTALSKLTWDEVMQVSPVFERTSEAAKVEFLASLGDNTGKTISLGLQTANVIVNHGKLVVEFTQGPMASKGLSLMMDKAGRLLPTLVDGKIPTAANGF